MSAGLPPSVSASVTRSAPDYSISSAALAMGWAVGRWRMKSLLSLVYDGRAALAVTIFLLSPRTATTLFIFAAVMA